MPNTPNERTETPLQKAKRLYSAIFVDSVYDEGSTLIEAIKNREGELYMFHDWLSLEHKIYGFQPSTVSTISTTLKKDNVKKDDDEISADGARLLPRAETLYTYGTIFIDIFDLQTIQKIEKKYTPFILHEINSYLKQEPQTSIASLPYANCEWDLYFLYYKNNNYRTEPFIGKAHLIVNGYNNVKLLNASMSPDEDYTIGRLIDLYGSGSTILSFDLQCEHSARNLHIKLYIDEPTQEIAIGEYISTESRHIQAGRIVFHNRQSNMVSPLPCGYYSFRDKEKFTQIHPQIRKFLTIRAYNFLILPKDISKLDNLNHPVNDDELISNYLHYAKNALFLERVLPEVWISAPVSGSNPNLDVWRKFEVDLQRNFLNTKGEKTIFIRFMDHISKKNTLERYYADIERLKSKRVFILLNEKTDKVSYSYLQWGIASIHCKRVLIVTRYEDISPRIRHLASIDTSLKVIFYDVINMEDLNNPKLDPSATLHSKWEDVILPQLVEEIKDFIPKYIDGNMKIL